MDEAGGSKEEHQDGLQEEHMLDDMHGDGAHLEDDEALEVIPLDDFLERYGANGPPADSDDDEDQQSTSNYSGMEEGERFPDESVGTLEAHQKDCFVLALYGERWLASGGEDDVAHIFDLNKSHSEPVASIQHKDSVTAVSFNSTGTLVASGDMSGKIVITQLNDLKTRAELDECSDLEWMFWHKTSDIVFAGDRDGMIWMWLIAASGVAQNKVYAAGSDSCTSGCLMHDGRRLLAGYSDGTAKLWNLKDQTYASVRCDSAIVCVAHHPTQSWGAVGSERGTVYLLNTRTEGQLKKVHYFAAAGAVPRPRRTDGDVEEDEEEEENVENCVETLSFAPNNPWLAAGRNDGSLSVYEVDMQGPRFIHRNESRQAISRAIWIQDGLMPMLATASVDGTLRMFDSRNGSVYKELHAGNEEILDLHLVQTGPVRLITACSGGALRIFEL